jgi:hypothetical protein
MAHQAPQGPSLQDDLLEGFESMPGSSAPQRSESRSAMGGRDPPISYPSTPTGEVPPFRTRTNNTTGSANDRRPFPRPTGTSASNRLVIAVDYGTTFTGKEPPSL